MARYLVISSQVAHGHVGLSAIVPVLQALGHEVIALPTILLSNHPGHSRVAGTHIDPEVLSKMLDALEANGRLAGLDGVLTGYLPTVEHVRFAVDAVQRVWRGMANRDGSYFCDPVIGDDPMGLYVAVDVARAIRDLLVPLAHTVSPNRFELEWLSGKPVTDGASAIAAGLGLGHDKFVCATSIPDGAEHLLTIETHVGVDGRPDSRSCRVSRRQRVPHGTGDMLSALLLALLPLGNAVAAVDAAIAASGGHDELQLSASRQQWIAAAPFPELPA